MARYLGIDYGQRRIGVAISDDGGRFAAALSQLDAAGDANADARRVAELARQHNAEAFVVGLPINMDDTEGPQARRTRRFADRLAERSGLPVHLQDERLSSFAADEVLSAAELTKAQRRRRRDKIAARMILQSFLDAQTPE